METTLLVAIAREGDSEGNKGADEIRRCGANERDGTGAEIKALDDRMVEVVELLVMRTLHHVPTFSLLHCTSYTS